MLGLSTVTMGLTLLLWTADGWWIRDWGWRIGQAATTQPYDSPDGFNGGRLVGGMQIACQDSCHNFDVSQLPYMYGCPAGEDGGLTYVPGADYGFFAAYYPQGHTSFTLQYWPHAPASNRAAAACTCGSMCLLKALQCVCFVEDVVTDGNICKTSLQA